MKRASSVIACLLVALLTGAQWFVLKSAALAGMTVVYSARAGLVDGLRETFDGEHPCCMCKAIEKAKEDEAARSKTPAAPVKEAVRLVGVACTITALLVPPAPRYGSTADDLADAKSRTDRPAVPPPR